MQPVLDSVEDFAGTFKALVRWCDKNYACEGEGSSRMAYKLDEDHCLKIAYNARGIAQNKVESHLAQKLHDLPITKIHYMQPQGWFRVVDYAHALNKEHFKDTYGLDFSAFCTYCGLFEYGKKEVRLFWPKLSDAAKKLFLSLKRHGVMLGDVRGAEQWGDLKEKPVLVDYGLNKEVWDKHYAHIIVVARLLRK